MMFEVIFYFQNAKQPPNSQNELTICKTKMVKYGSVRAQQTIFGGHRLIKLPFWYQY